MAFDVQGALKAGYSPAEIADYLGSQEGFDVTAARKAGYKDDEITAHLLAVAPAAPVVDAAPAPAPAPMVFKEATPDAALQLLGLLQREARLIDEEGIGPGLRDAPRHGHGLRRRSGFVEQ